MDDQRVARYPIAGQDSNLLIFFPRFISSSTNCIYVDMLVPLGIFVNEQECKFYFYFNSMEKCKEKPFQFILILILSLFSILFHFLDMMFYFDALVLTHTQTTLSQFIFYLLYNFISLPQLFMVYGRINLCKLNRIQSR